MIFLLHPRAGFAIGVATLLTLALSSAPSLAGDAAKGGKIAAVKCSACHGIDGLSKLPQAPNIAGQVEQYLVEQIQAFRNGARKNEMMTLVVKPLSDSEVADLAAYYAAIEVKIGKVPGQ